MENPIIHSQEELKNYTAKVVNTVLNIVAREAKLCILSGGDQEDIETSFMSDDERHYIQVSKKSIIDQYSLCMKVLGMHATEENIISLIEYAFAQWTKVVCSEDIFIFDETIKRSVLVSEIELIKLRSGNIVRLNTTDGYSENRQYITVNEISFESKKKILDYLSNKAPFHDCRS